MAVKKKVLRGILACLLSISMLIAMPVSSKMVYADAENQNTLSDSGSIEKEEADILSDSSSSEKTELSELVSYMETAVEDVDYVSGMVFKATDSKDEADSIAKAYGAELVGYDYGVAVFKLPKGLSVKGAIELAADTTKDYPLVYPNLISKSEVSAIYEEADILAGASNEESENLLSSVAGNNFSDPYLYENATQGTVNSYQWHHEAVGSIYAWANGITGKNVKVAIIANGINKYHIDAPLNIYASKTFNQGIAIADTSDVDITGFGTAAAGLLASPINGKLGVGVAPEVSIDNIKTFGSVASLIAAINCAIENKDDIVAITDSYDFPDDTVKDLELAVIKAYEYGVTVFAPVGATGGQYEVYPAAYKNVVCVGATDKSNQRAAYYSYSNSVDIAVPGTELWTMYSQDKNLYGAFNGNVMLSSIAAGEAALILEQAAAKKIPSLLDSSENLLTGSKKVDALVKCMKANTVKAGSGTGSGIVYIPKALGLVSSITAPKAPEITIDPVTSTNVRVHIKADALASKIIYTVNGKKPGYKDGKASEDSRIIYGSYSDDEYIDITDITSDYLTINAIAVDPFGKISNVSSGKVALTGYVDSVAVSGPSKVMPGRSITMTSAVIPSNTSTKLVKWHVSFNGSEEEAKNKGVTIANNGILKAQANAVSGSYQVWAETKVLNKLSPKVDVVVNTTQNISAISPVNAKETKYIENGYTNIDLAPLFNVTKIDGTAYAKGDLYFSSSNPAIAEITDDVVTLKKAGNVVITATANDGSSVNNKCTLNIVQKVAFFYLEGNGYDKIARGASINLKPVILPYYSATKKVTSWNIDSNGASNGITVKNGKITTSAGTSPGTYTITAEIIDVDGSKKTANYDFEVIPMKVTKITAPKTVTIFSGSNNFSAKDFAEVKIGIEGGERNGENKCISSSVKISFSNNELINPYYGCPAEDLNSLIFPVKSAGIGTGTVKMTVEALDGSGKKAVTTIKIVNPASSVRVAPKKADVDYLTAGKTTNFKAVMGSEYGTVTNKNVEWSIIEGGTYAKISPSGAVKVDAKTPDYTFIKIRATAKDGSGAYGDFGTYTLKNPGKFEITDEYGNSSKYFLKGLKEVKEEYGLVFYVKVPVGDADSYEKVINGMTYGKFKLSSSKPLNLTVRRDESVPSKKVTISGKNYELYYFKAIGVKAGAGKITIASPDNSQKISLNVKVIK